MLLTKKTKILYTISRSAIKIIRNESLKDHPTIKGFDRDGFPMAMFKEGGKGASVRYINPIDNRGAISSIANALKSFPDGTKVKIKVE